MSTRHLLCGVVVALLALSSMSHVTFDLLKHLLTPGRGDASILDPRVYPTAATRAVAVGAVALAGVATCRVVREGRRFAVVVLGSALLAVGMAGAGVRLAHRPPDLAARSLFLAVAGLSVIGVVLTVLRGRVRLPQTRQDKK